MPSSETVTILQVRVTGADSERADRDQSQAGSRFWVSMLKKRRYGNPPELGPEGIEPRLRKILALRLWEYLALHARQSTERVLSRHRHESVAFHTAPPNPHLHGMFFEIKDVRFGSLTFGVAVAGLAKLAAFFEQDLSLFKAVFDAYLPAAVQDCFEEFDLTEFTYDMTLTPALLAAFTEAPPKPNSPQNVGEKQPPDNKWNMARDNVRWAWLASNTSLVLPVVLALAILYVAFQTVAAERASFTQAVEEWNSTREERALEAERQQHQLILTLLNSTSPPKSRTLDDQPAQSDFKESASVDTSGGSGVNGRASSNRPPNPTRSP